MKNRNLTLFFLIAGILPIYVWIAWVNIFNKHPNLTHQQKQQLFNNEVFFGLGVEQHYVINALILLLGIASIIFFSVRMAKFNTWDHPYRVLKLVGSIGFTFLVFVCTLLNVWSML